MAEVLPYELKIGKSTYDGAISYNEKCEQNLVLADGEIDRAMVFGGVTTANTILIHSDRQISVRFNSATGTSITIIANRPFFQSGTLTTSIYLTNQSGAAANLRLSVWDSSLTSYAGATISSFVYNVKAQPYGATGDNSTDDSGAIQAAVTAGAGHTVLFPDGIYLVGTTITVPANTHIILSKGATVKAKTNLNACIFLSTNATEVKFSGAGTIDGNKANQDGAIGSGNKGSAIRFNGCTNCEISELTIEDVAEWAILAYQSTAIKIHDCFFYDNYLTAIELVESPGGMIEDNYIYVNDLYTGDNLHHPGGIGVVTNSYRAKVAGNYIVQTTASNVNGDTLDCSQALGLGWDSAGAVVTGNFVYGGGNGLSIGGNRNTTVSDNYVSGIETIAGIEVGGNKTFSNWDATGTVVSGNTVDDCTGLDGIGLHGCIVGVEVSTNFVTNCSIGIAVLADATNTASSDSRDHLISKNHIFNSTTYAILLSRAGNGSLIDGNKIVDAGEPSYGAVSILSIASPSPLLIDDITISNNKISGQAKYGISTSYGNAYAQADCATHVTLFGNVIAGDGTGRIDPYAIYSGIIQEDTVTKIGPNASPVTVAADGAITCPADGHFTGDVSAANVAATTKVSAATVLGSTIVGVTSFGAVVAEMDQTAAGGIVIARDASLNKGIYIDGRFGMMGMHADTGVVAGVAGIAKIYAHTSGGKIRIMAIFPTGVAQQIAIEP